MAEQSFAFATAQLKTVDPDRYFATLPLPEAKRRHVQALYAFNADVASIRDRVREPAPGEIRLQWWADALSGQGHGAVRSNPLADALLDVLERYNLPTVPLLRLIAARRFDLYDDPMPNLQSFEGYAGETVSVLHQFAAMILNDGREVADGDAAGHLGVAEALIGHLSGFGFYASRGRLFLPWNIFAANGVNEGEIFAGTISEGLLAAHAQLTDIAKEHLDKAEAAVRSLPKAIQPAFGIIALLPSRLRAVVAQAESPFAPPRVEADWLKIARIAAWALRRA